MLYDYQLLGDPKVRSKPLIPLIDGILHRKTINILFGLPGSAKTFIAQQWALSVATGMPWCGHEAHKGAILYICAEGHQGFINRLAAYQMRNHTSLAKTKFFINHEQHNPQLLETDVDGKRYYTQHLRKEVERIERDHNCVIFLVVIDTLSRIAFGDEHSENSADSIAELFKELKTNLVDRPQGTSVLLVHHQGWSADKRLRGSSALQANADAIYGVEKIEGGEILLENMKIKDGEIPLDKHFVLRTGIKVAKWKPTPEDIAQYQAMGLPVPSEEWIESAVLEENIDTLSVVCCYDADGNAVTILDVLTEVETNGFTTIKIFQENLNLNVENARKAIRTCVARAMLQKDQKIYTITQEALDLMSFSNPQP